MTQAARIEKPYLDPSIQEKLTEIGGVVPSGKYAGQPRIKIVWEPEETEFRNGRERPRFIEHGKSEYIYKRWFISPKLYAELAKWANENLPKHINPAFPLRFSEFFKTASPLEFVALADSDSPHSEAIAPEGWHYITDLDEFREKPLPFFFVLQYVSAEQLPDTYDSWNAQRFDIAFCPEVRQHVLLDCLGEYPKDGLYFIQVLELYKEDAEGNKTPIEPAFETVIVPVQKLVQERDRQTGRERDKDERTKNFFSAMDAARRRAGEKDWQKYDDITADNRPAFENASDWVSASGCAREETKSENN